MNSTDVLKAQCCPVGDRIYRLLPIRNSLNSEEDDRATSTSNHESINFVEDDDIDPDLPILHKGNIFYINFHVPSSLMGIVIGAEFKNVKALENQYGAKINIPRAKTATGITVSGSTKKIVFSTYFSIMNKVIKARLRKESTHFISFPANSPNIQESFLKFKEGVLTKCKKVRGIDESIFQKPNKLHLTVVPLVLLDDMDKEKASAILTKCRNDYLEEFGEKEFVVRVKGIEYMNDDPAEVDVLYAKLQESDDDNSLQILGDRIMNKFIDENFSRKQHDNVKLHITLMNTLFRDNLESREDNNYERVTFDATQILKDYANYDFGQMIISEIHISIRYTGGSQEYYSAAHKVKLNS